MMNIYHMYAITLRKNYAVLLSTMIYGIYSMTYEVWTAIQIKVPSDIVMP